ncbi:hypothetical protein D3C72_359870 [compost metagenome]
MFPADNPVIVNGFTVVLPVPVATVVPAALTTVYEYAPVYPVTFMIKLPSESPKHVTGVGLDAITSMVSKGRIS